MALRRAILALSAVVLVPALVGATCAELLPLSVTSDLDDGDCDIHDISKTSLMTAVIVAVICVIICALPAEMMMLYLSHPKFSYVYPLNLGLFGFNVWSTLMCWSVYNTVKQVEGVDPWIPSACFMLSLMTLLQAIMGLFVGFHQVFFTKTVPDFGWKAAAMLLSPWEPLLTMYFKGDDKSLDHLDLISVVTTHINYFVSQLPLGSIGIYVMVHYTGFDFNIFSKVATELVALITFWIVRLISPPPWGPCGCLHPQAAGNADSASDGSTDKSVATKDEMAAAAADTEESSVPLLKNAEGESGELKKPPSGGCCVVS